MSIFTSLRNKLFDFFIARESTIGIFFSRYVLQYPITQHDLKQFYSVPAFLPRSFKLLASYYPQETTDFFSSQREELLHDQMQAEKVLIEEERTAYAQMMESIELIKAKQCLQERALNEASAIIEAEKCGRMHLPFPLGQPKTHESAQRAGVIIPSPLPLFDNSPNIDQLESWALSQQTPMLRRIAQKIIKCINFIHFDVFLRQLMKVTQEFNQYIGDRSYVLLIGVPKDKCSHGSSEQWVSGLALEYCELKQPVEIVKLDDLKSYLTENPDTQHMLCLDDAIYSGTQKHAMVHEIFDTIPTMNIELILGITYISSHGMNVIAQLQQRYNRIKLLSPQVFPMPRESFDDEENKYLSNMDSVLIRSITLTYFTHRFPDAISTYQRIYTGFPIFTRRDIEKVNWITGKSFDWPLDDLFNGYEGCNIPYTLRPYRALPLVSSYDQKEFETALESKRMGPRTNIPLPKKITAVPFNCNLFKHNGFFYPFSKPVGVNRPGYPPPLLPLDEQCQLDETIMGLDETIMGPKRKLSC